MIQIYEFKNLNLKVTWSLLYCGYSKSSLFSERIYWQDIVDYAWEQLNLGESNDMLWNLACLTSDYIYEVEECLKELSYNESLDYTIENRKIRAVLLYRILSNSYENYIDGLIDLSEFWMDHNFFDDSPHTIQGVNNTIPPSTYYTKDNYEFLFAKNLNWLENELHFLRKA